MLAGLAVELALSWHLNLRLRHLDMQPLTTVRVSLPDCCAACCVCQGPSTRFHLSPGLTLSLPQAHCAHAEPTCVFPLLVSRDRWEGRSMVATAATGLAAGSTSCGGSACNSCTAAEWGPCCISWRQYNLWSGRRGGKRPTSGCVGHRTKVDLGGIRERGTSRRILVWCMCVGSNTPLPPST